MKILLLFLFAFSLSATTRIQESQMVDPGGRKIQTGSAKICPASSFTSGSSTVLLKQCAVFPITAGRFVANLIPTDTATPLGQYYRVTWNTSAGTWSEVWLIPTSGGVLRVADVLVPTGQQTYLANGTYCISVVSGRWSVIGTSSCPTGGGGTGVVSSWAAITSVTWAAVTSTTWSAVTI